MSARLSLLGRLARAGRAVLGGSGRPPAPARPLSLPTEQDFRGTFFPCRRVSPQLVRYTLENAARGDLVQQWDLFALMEDTWPRLAKNLAELRRAAARATYSVQPYTERGAAPTASALARAALVERALRRWQPRPGTLELSFEDMLFHALDAFGKGIAVLELQWQLGDDGLLPRCAHLLSPRRYGWNEAGTELGLTSGQLSAFSDRRMAGGSYHSSLVTHHSAALAGLPSPDPAWQPFPQDHFLVAFWHARSGAPGATATLRALAPYWGGVTFGWEWLMATAQIFGVPFRWATYDANRPELGTLLRDMLAQMGSCGYGAFPDGTKLDFKEAVANAGGNPQVVVQELANQACDLLILGQELSGTAQAAGLGGGAAYFQQAVRADRLQAAAQWCADLLNYQLVPAVQRANFGDNAEPPTIVPDLSDEPDPLKLAQRDQVLLECGVTLPAAWFYERHAVPQPAGGEAVVAGAGRGAGAASHAGAAPAAGAAAEAPSSKSPSSREFSNHNAQASAEPPVPATENSEP